MRVIASIEDPGVVRRILAHLGLSSAPVRPDPAQPPPEPTAVPIQDRFAD
jgi:hypothetical protein